MPPTHTIRDAPAHEDATLSDVLARSFWDDPVMSWMVPNERARYTRLRRFFRAELWTARRRGTVLTTADQAGAALWLPPDRWKTELRDYLRQTPSALRAFSFHLVPALRLLSRMEHAHPREPHWYLAVIGTDPSRQGLGVGSALITEITDRCDNEGLGAYLESSKDVNVPYYERFGFRVTDEVTAPNGPTLWLMWRDPR
jgi:GNAT superfamily N-acetyltransferase